MKTHEIGAILACIVPILLLFSGCSPKMVDTSGYAPQSIVELQQSVPFPIVLPKLLPQGESLDPGFARTSPVEDTVPATVKINLIYYQKTGTIYLRIVEGNGDLQDEVTYVSHGNPNTNVISINGFKVNEAFLQNGFAYDWFQDGIRIIVWVYGYGKNQSRQIVGSMIK